MVRATRNAMITASLALTSCIFTSCAHNNHSKSELDTASQVAKYLRDIGTMEGPGIAQFELGTLSGGTAVLIRHWQNNDKSRDTHVGAMFWVKDGVIYAVNEKASDIAPELTAAPDEISEMEVVRVVH